MHTNAITFEKLAQRLELRGKLDGGDHEAIARLDYTTQHIVQGGYLVSQGQQQETCPLIFEGYAYRQKLTASGSRQIVAIQLPGDFVDLQTLFLAKADHNVQALTEMSVALVTMNAMRELVLQRPTIAKALWIEALIEASIYREWIVNNGRRDASSRVAHLICEMGIRMSDIGLSERDNYILPMTQEEIADCVSLTSVHVNRVLKGLSDDGLIKRNKRHIVVENWNSLQDKAEFDDQYLHLSEKKARFTT